MDKEEKMIEEYKLCQQKTQHLESMIWKTSGIIGIGSLSALIYFAKQAVDEAGKPQERLFLFFGAIVVITVWIWWFMAKRWWDIQHWTFERMRDIEEDLIAFFQIRYIDFKDGYRSPCLVINELGNGDNVIGKKRANKLKVDHRFKKRRVQGTVKWFLWMITAVWLLLINFQLINFMMISIPIRFVVGTVIIWACIIGAIITKT
ncbi:MAG: hypothetical protein FVQ80_16960 [Planctomycetes bacterium]|nr:hypothetical protein [Planctomycetota bacterium]